MTSQKRTIQTGITHERTRVFEKRTWEDDGKREKKGGGEWQKEKRRKRMTRQGTTIIISTPDRETRRQLQPAYRLAWPQIMQNPEPQHFSATVVGGERKEPGRGGGVEEQMRCELGSGGCVSKSNEPNGERREARR